MSAPREVSLHVEVARIKEYEELMVGLPCMLVGEASDEMLPTPDLKLGLAFSGDFGVRVLDHLVNAYKHCNACGHLCIDRKCKYGKYSFASNVVFVHEAPPREELPLIIDEPSMYMPKRIPEVDVVIATGLHSDLYLGYRSVATIKPVTAYTTHIALRPPLIPKSHTLTPSLDSRCRVTISPSSSPISCIAMASASKLTPHPSTMSRGSSLLVNPKNLSTMTASASPDQAKGKYLRGRRLDMASTHG